MDLKELEALLHLMEGSDIEELELEEEGRKVRIRRRGAEAATLRSLVAPGAHGPAQTATASPLAAGGGEDSGLIPVESPMIGTFYRAPAPGSDPYVKEGDLVHKGSVLCIIEAMKLMNEIEAEVSGRVVKIQVENGQPVEFGQILFLLEPA
ncbi:MAG TPA: acetyl-CoA carboxylase biotin carboxyl carrier protein [Candidatus Methylomirabilis sp.]|nr:acetyl-CoA carboxylase biotin carboxyl carrier protein [Candidatus Methylomirabilis sp.]